MWVNSSELLVFIVLLECMKNYWFLPKTEIQRLERTSVPLTHFAGKCNNKAALRIDIKFAFSKHAWHHHCQKTRNITQKNHNETTCWVNEKRPKRFNKMTKDREMKSSRTRSTKFYMLIELCLMIQKESFTTKQIQINISWDIKKQADVCKQKSSFEKFIVFQQRCGGVRIFVWLIRVSSYRHSFIDLTTRFW